MPFFTREVNRARLDKTFLFLTGVMFLVAPSFYHVNLGEGGFYLPFNALTWLFAAFLAGASLLVAAHNGRITFPPLFLSFALFGLAVLVLGLIGEKPVMETWAFRLLTIFSGLLLYWALCQFDIDERKADLLILIVVCSASLQAIYCWLQLLLGEGVPLFIPVSPDVPRGIFQQQNLAATYTATGVMGCLYLLAKPRGWLGAVLAFLLCLNLSVVLMSGSRIGLLAVFLGVLCFFLSSPRLRHPRTLIPLLLAFSLAMLASVTFNDGGGIGRAVSKFNAVVQADTLGRGDVRKTIYDSSFDLFLQKPWLGHGIGNFERVWQDYKPEYHAKNPHAAHVEKRLTHPHNELLLWAVEGGVVLFLFLGLIAYGVVRLLASLGWREGLRWLAILSPVVLHTQVEKPFYISHLHLVLLVFLLVILVRGHDRGQVFELGFSGKVGSLVLAVSVPVFGSAVLSHTMLANYYITQATFFQATPMELVRFAKGNPFFNRRAGFLEKQAQLRTGLRSGDRGLLADYVTWGRAYLEQVPSPVVMADVAVALYELGRISETRALLNRLQEIYPFSPSVNDARDYLARRGFYF
ncbi:PglL family O-oligosaccharyltransferase [Motiliproteus sp. SC1-56]|uniref:PglL family O-oligosaccharyltransferase n=1 Tax=Motiliproteus sp. SC1-56 TaxID=2799565 RepID=UPI001A8C4560|nr:Wzy polymerase domain-containing protein [Motiliproteus sp. SC1-56]